MVAVMAYDFIKHNFNLRPSRQTNSSPQTANHMEFIADALWKHRIKLSATLAKMRVVAGVRTTTELLPQPLQAKSLDLVSKSLFARIANSDDAVHKQILLTLSTAGITLLNHVSQLPLSKKAVAHVTRDLLAFTPDCRMWVYNSDLMQKGYLVIEVDILLLLSLLVINIVSNAHIVSNICTVKHCFYCFVKVFACLTVVVYMHITT